MKKVLILATILAVPALAYYLLQEKGKNRYRPLSIFGPKIPASSFHFKKGRKIPDTIYHVVHDFKLLNQDSQTTSFPSDSNRLSVVAFFYTRCSRTCSQINKRMSDVFRVYKKNKLIKFFSITVDPSFDTPAVLKEYAGQYRAQSGKWIFLTGEEATIYNLVKEDFLLDTFRDTSQKNNIIHSSMLVLLDPNKRIRGYYDSLDKEQVDRLIDEIRVLIAEELRQTKRY